MRLWNRVRQNPVAHWCLLFLVLATTIDTNNNDNPRSRYALLMSIAENQQLTIDPYWRTTCDWSRTPDGHYYSNKAPGPTLLALPLYLPLDALIVSNAKDRKVRDARRMEARESLLDLLSLALQAIPFALLVMVSAEMLAARGVSRAAIELCALAMLFGNTASMFMNTYFGHGVAAALTLGIALALPKRRHALVGLLFGLDVLSDYGTALFLPILVVLICMTAETGWKPKLRGVLRFALGGLAPLVVFLAYHALCFGGPLTLPNKFMNPVFVEKGGRALWGVIDFLPNSHAAYELLFGVHRGLLVTQPWVLLLVALLLLMAWRKRWWMDKHLAAEARTVLPLALGGLAVLLLMNASFGGWHGGVCPGPRYLSAILPVLGLALGLSYDAFPRPLRLLLWLSVLPGLVIFAIVGAGDPAVWPDHYIWRRCHDTLFKFAKAKTYLSLSWIVFAFAATTMVAVLRARWARSRRVVSKGIDNFLY